MRTLTTKGYVWVVIVILLAGILWAICKEQQISAIITEPWYTVELMVVRAYCPDEECCGRWADGHTAWNNYEIQPGDKFVAANPDFIPFGSMVTVPGYNNDLPVLVLDRTWGGLEVFFDDHQEALEWGKQMLEVKIERW